KLNNQRGNFNNYYIGKFKDRNKKIINIDSFCKLKNIDFIDILHSDIQGYEYDMLLGATEMLSSKKIGCVFISTHSNELHEKCLNFLTDNFGFKLISSANLDQSYSYDGVIVMKSPQYMPLDGVNNIKITTNN